MAALKELHPLSLIKTDDSANAASRVFMIENRVLLPGDSIASEEKKWGLFVRKHPITLLVLGHHGSRTSTSEALLKNLPHLKQAIASARREVYGHPHKTVLKRLKKNGVAVIATEDWGSLHWELPRPKIIDRKDGTQDSSCERQARSTHCRRKR